MAVPPTSRGELRNATRAARRRFVATLDTDARATLEAALAARLAPLLRGCVASYAAMADEIAPPGSGVWPRVGAGDAPLSFHRAAVDDLAPSRFGVREPRADAPRAVPDTVIVPLIAADAHGNRLGYGKGLYDRTLPALGALRIGIAWDVQVVDAVPAEPWDAPLDWLVTPTQTIDCAATRRDVGGGARKP